MLNPAAPWHMWGTGVTVETTAAPITGGPLETPHQLARVEYKRPDTWRFMLWGRLLGGDAAVNQPTNVFAWYDVYLGVGRSVLDTQRPVPAGVQAFGTFRWVVPIGMLPGAQDNNKKYTTRVDGPVLDDTGTDRLPIEWLTAENVTVRVRMRVEGDAGLTIRAELGAFLAPNVHIRPDWSSQQYRGGERGGS